MCKTVDAIRTAIKSGIATKATVREKRRAALRTLYDWAFVLGQAGKPKSALYRAALLESILRLPEKKLNDAFHRGRNAQEIRPRRFKHDRRPQQNLRRA